MSKRNRLLGLVGIALAAGAFALWYSDGDSDGSGSGERVGFSGGEFFPGAGLTTVTHDSTLAGSGTSTNPLTVVSGAGISGTGTNTDLTVWTGASSVGNFAGSSPTACTAGQALTNEAISAAGALTNTCTTLISGTNTDLTVFTSANTIGNYAGSSPAACGAGAATTNPTLSASGALTNTCTTLIAGTSGNLTAFTGANAIGNYAGSSPSACTAGQADTNVALSAAGALTHTCSAFVTSSTLTNNTIVKATGAGATANSADTDDGTTTTIGDAFATGPTITTTDTGTVNDYAPTGIGTAGILRLNPASGLTINGITTGVANRLLVVCNVGAGNVSLANEAAGSTAANRIEAQQNSNLQLPTSTNANSCALLSYDGTSSRWRVVSTNTSTFNALINTSGITNATATNVTLSGTSHLSNSSGTAPTLSSCGTSPTITGGDLAGRVTLGSSTTACTITFAATYTNAPSCIVHPEGTATQPTYTTSATAITISVGIASTVYDYICVKAS